MAEEPGVDVLTEQPPGHHAVELDRGERRVRARRWPLAVGGGLAALVAVSVLLRLEGQGGWLWIDEGISVGISSHRLSAIPGLLRLDGSPPLYYLLLHGWMRVFGRSETQVHALSLACTLATVPVALWAGWSLFGRRAGWIAVTLAATSPYLTFYSREARMYTLLGLLALVATTCFVHAFAFGRRGYLPGFVLALAGVLYTHNWGLYVALGAAAALVPCLAAAPDRRRLVVDAGLAFGAVGLLFAPWLPTLLFQVRHSGAPWSGRPVLRELLSSVDAVLGDTRERVAVALVLGAGGALAGILLRPRSVEGSAAAALTTMLGVTLGAGWLSGHAGHGWSPRYFVAFLPALFLLAALGLARAGARGLVALGLTLLFWTQPLARLAGSRAPVPLDDKGIEKALVDAVSPPLRPGDLVVAMQMEEVPVLRYYLERTRPGVVLADPGGAVAEPGVADWRDALVRLRAASPARGLTPLLDRLPVGGHLVLVCARGADASPGIEWFRLMITHCAEWRRALDDDRRFEHRPVPALASLAGNASGLTTLFAKVSG